MKIICPECQFERIIPDDKIPASSVRATCPKCHTKFQFRSLDEPEFLLEEAPSEPEMPMAPASASASPEYAEEPAQASAVAAPASEEPTAQADAPLESDAPTSEQESPVTAEAQQAPLTEETTFPETSPDQPKAQDINEAPKEQRPARHVFIEPDESLSAPAQKTQPGQDDIWSRLEDMGENKQSGDEHFTNGQFGAHDDAEPDDTDAPWQRSAKRPTVDVPFERLDKYGFFNGFSETIKRACLSPRLFFSSMPLGTGLKRPLAFYLLTSELSAFFQTVWQVMGLDVMMYLQGGASSTEHAMTTGTMFAVLLVLPILLAIGIMITAGITHLILLPFKAAKNGFEATFKVCCYGAAPTLLAAVPLLGPLVGSLWYMALMVIGIKHAHDTTYTRVTIAFLVPFLILTALITAAILSNNGQAPQLF